MRLIFQTDPLPNSGIRRLLAPQNVLVAMGAGAFASGLADSRLALAVLVLFGVLAVSLDRLEVRLRRSQRGRHDSGRKLGR